MIYICVTRSDYFHGQYVPVEKVTHDWGGGELLQILLFVTLLNRQFCK